MTQDWIQQTEQDAAKSGGGGGIVAQIELHRGFKVFISGMDNRKSFFPYKVGDAKAQAEAKKKAEDTGSRPQDSLEMIVFKATVKSKKVVDDKEVSVGESWKDDRFFVDPLWTQGFKEVILPALKEQKPPLGEKFWGKVSFAPDPSGRTKPNQQGVEQPNLIAFVSKVYKDEAEATQDATSAQGSNGAEPHDPMVPADYDKATWLGCKAEMIKELDAIAQGIAESMKGKPGPQIKKALMDAKNAKVAQLAEQYVATVEQVNHLIDS